ncbi:hypothetical protein IWW57_006146, partial [Coemansia sp. S610]
MSPASKSSKADAYADEPWSDRTLSNYIVRAEHPFNAEVRLDKLVEDFVTPTDKHFRRNHGPIPNIDGSEWTMSVEIGCKAAPARLGTKTIRLEDLVSLRQFEVVA